MADIRDELSWEAYDAVKQYFKLYLDEYTKFVEDEDWEDVDEALYTIKTKEELETIVNFMDRWIL